MQRYEITSMIKQLWEQRISIHSIIKIKYQPYDNK